MIGFDPILLLLKLLGIGSRGFMVIAAIFWIWVLYDCITKEASEGNDKIVWLLLILFVPLFGAVLYYFVRRPERIKAIGK